METKTIQFTAGRGPAECTWVVAKVLKTFIKNSSNAGNIIYYSASRKRS